MGARKLWESYMHWLLDEPDLGVRLDVSRMGLPEDAPAVHTKALEGAFAAMDALEKGRSAPLQQPANGRPVIGVDHTGDRSGRRRRLATTGRVFLREPDGRPRP